MLSCQKELFNLPDDTHYLNCAYMSPMLKSVAHVGNVAIHGKDDPTTIKPDDFFQNTKRLREAFAKLIGVQDERQCAIVPSVSYGLANVAKNLKGRKGDNIVLAGEQFPSNVYAWMALAEEHQLELRLMEPPTVFEDRAQKWNEHILDQIDEHTCLVSTGHVHWADGTLFDLKAIRKRSREVDALMVIDGTQSIGALPFDVADIQPDAIVVAGYKWLMGPYALGVAYYGPRLADGQPIENNWMNRLNSENFGGLINYQNAYQDGSIRYEMGESANFILSPMLTRAIEQVQTWGPQNIQQYCADLSLPFIPQLKAMGVQIEHDAYRSHHLFGLRLPEHASMDVIQEALHQGRIFVSVRGNSIRVAPHLYNDKHDFEALIDCFSTALK